MLGFARVSFIATPSRAVGEHEAQLMMSLPSQPISPFAQPTFTGFIALTKRSDFCWDVGGRRFLLPAYRSRGPQQISRGKNTECTAAAALITAPVSVGFWASRYEARSPDRIGLFKGLLAFGAAVRLRLLPHTTSRHQRIAVSRRERCVQLPSTYGCYQLAP